MPCRQQSELSLDWVFTDNSRGSVGLIRFVYAALVSNTFQNMVQRLMYDRSGAKEHVAHN